MTFKTNDSAWTTKGATLSHKSAEKEFGLTLDEIVAAIRAGKLRYRENSIYGAPFLRLIRSEVEALVSEKYGKDHLNKKKWKKELADIKKNLKQLKAETLAQETRKAELLELLSDKGK
ncbi:MAG TPA: hypothetical protein VLA72_21225 [Anaerolineales bacterium]|nr:hypothetical protein [Anaerolineales bacterium]